MEDFLVTNIVDGDTFDVEPKWVWEGATGSRVRPTGFDAPEVGGLAGELATSKLRDLILDKTVQLGEAYKIDRDRLVCDVFFQGKNLASYFK